MKLPRFEYRPAETVDQALSLLAEAGDEAKLLAGGQSLLAAMAFRLVRPSVLVDIDSLPGLAGLEIGDELRIGPLVRHATLERAALEGAWSVLPEAAALIGHLPIRTRGTVGGSLAHADPAAELPVAMLALDAAVVARSRAGERTIPADEFFTGPYATALGPEEMIVELRLPGRPGSRGDLAEFAERPGDFALASVCAVSCERGVRIALGGVAPTPVRATDAELALGAGGSIEEAAAIAAGECEPASDSHATADFRRELVAVLTRRTLSRVLGTA